eukprot:Lithocolla_globosa_v1_NODE_4641_length_1395_cov_28.476866.p1 type:complete len:246 gc:universal NODE_4641_length_1395_cov_28.476866:1007-270(-)
MLISLSFFFVVVNSHGYFTIPPSREDVALQNGEDYCPHCVLEDNVEVGPPGRPYPGNRPFAEPGQGIINSGPSYGPCGSQDSNNYNMPMRSWGKITASYRQGETITVEWCDIADHKGVYSYRICQDQSLVDKFLNPNRAPTTEEMFELEECFSRGILPCYDVAGQACPISDGCQPDWGCAQRNDWFHCDRAGCREDGRCKNNGLILRDQVKLPQGFVSNHTLLSWRWDAMDTPQLYLNCADISIF